MTVAVKEEKSNFNQVVCGKAFKWVIVCYFISFPLLFILWKFFPGHMEVVGTPAKLSLFAGLITPSIFFFTFFSFRIFKLGFKEAFNGIKAAMFPVFMLFLLSAMIVFMVFSKTLFSALMNFLFFGFLTFWAMNPSRRALGLSWNFVKEVVIVEILFCLCLVSIVQRIPSVF